MKHARIRASTGAALRGLYSKRYLTVGGATVAGLDAFAAQHDRSVPRRRMPRTDWTIPRLGFGGDDIGATGSERIGLFLEAVRRGGNVLLIDGEHVYARREVGSDLWSHRAVDRDWEAIALAQLWASGLNRSEIVIMARLSAATGRESLRDRLAALLVALDLQRVDILHVSVPLADGVFPTESLHPIFSECEALVGSGYTQFYGLACESFSALDAGVDGDNPLAAGVPLRAVFSTAESVRGLAAETRRRADVDTTTSARGAGNVFSRPTSSTSSPRPSAAALSAPAIAPPAGDRHHLVSVMYPMSLTRPWPAVPAVTDSRDLRQSLSASDLASRYGLAQFIRAPFDAWQDMPAADTLLGLGSAEGGAAALQHERVSRLFRCVDTPERNKSDAAAVPASDVGVVTELDTSAARSSASPPGSDLAALSDALNAAVHLEFAWEDKGVAAAVEAAAAQLAVGTVEDSAAVAPPDDAGDERNAPTTAPLDNAATAYLATLMAPTTMAVAQPLLSDDVRWARTLAANLDRLDSWAEWRELRGRRILPALARVAAVARRVPDAREWCVAYVAAVSEVAARVDALQEAGQAARAVKVSAVLDAAVPGLAATPHLHAKTARLLLSAAPLVDTLLTEVPEAFGLRRRSPRDVAAVREATIAAAASAAVSRGAVPANNSSDAGAPQSSPFGGSELALESRLAARSAEIDALIASVVSHDSNCQGGSTKREARTLVSDTDGGHALITTDAKLAPQQMSTSKPAVAQRLPSANSRDSTLGSSLHAVRVQQSKAYHSVFDGMQDTLPQSLALDALTSSVLSSALASAASAPLPRQGR